MRTHRDSCDTTPTLLLIHINPPAQDRPSCPPPPLLHRRIYEAIAAGCIPVIIADRLGLGLGFGLGLGLGFSFRFSFGFGFG